MCCRNSFRTYSGLPVPGLCFCLINLSRPPPTLLKLKCCATAAQDQHCMLQGLKAHELCLPMPAALAAAL